MNGACYARCPNFGDLMTYITVDSASGDATLQNQTDLRTYVCKLIFDAPGDNYDCKTGPEPGFVVKMVTQGLRSQYCTGGDFGGFGVNDKSASLSQTEKCGYGCVLPRG